METKTEDERKGDVYVNHTQHILTRKKSLKKWYDRFEKENQLIKVQFT